MEGTLKIELDYDLLAEKVVERVVGKFPKPPSETPTERHKIFGIRGLASHIGCSVSKAQSLKNEGTIPFYEYGNRVFFYGDEVDNALKRR